MDSVERLTPAALKESAKLKALALISDGYVQADDNLLCPICGMRFLLLLDLKDRSDHRQRRAEVHDRAVMFFEEMIKQDHAAGHPHERFAMG
jgi:hypothetical protein